MPDLSVQAPEGSHFEFEMVKTGHGKTELGDAPILIWDDLDKATECYTAEGICNILNGTSFRVSMQGIARRLKISGKSDDEIADQQVKFRPGKRTVGESTPVSRARSAAAKAAEVAGGDIVANLLKAIAEGKISAEDAQALAGVTNE